MTRQRAYSRDEVVAEINELFREQYYDEDQPPWGIVWTNLLVERLDISRATASKYLSELEEEGLLYADELGGSQIYFPSNLKTIEYGLLGPYIAPCFGAAYPKEERLKLIGPNIKLRVMNGLSKIGVVEPPFIKSKPSVLPVENWNVHSLA